MLRVFFCILSMLLLNQPATAQTLAPAADIIRIPSASGEGPTAEAALRDAFTNAIQQAVGVYLTADEMLDVNGDAVQEIATFSNGYIVWYEKVSQPDAPDGGKRVLISCDVSRSRTAARLKQSGIRIPESDTGKVDSKPLFAKEVTKKKLNSDTQVLLTALLKEIPGTKDLLTGARLLPRRLEPQENENGDGYFCEVHFRLEYNYRVLTDYCQWVDRTLQHAGLAGRRETTINHRYEAMPVRGFRQEHIQLNPELDPRMASTFLNLRQIMDQGTRGAGALVLLTGFACDDEMDVDDILKTGSATNGRPHIRTTWVVYPIDRSVLKAVRQHIYRTQYPQHITHDSGYEQFLSFSPTSTKVAVEFTDSAGQVVAASRSEYQESLGFTLEHAFEEPQFEADRGNLLIVSFLSIMPRLSFVNPIKQAVVRLSLSDLEAIEKSRVRIIR